MTTFPVAPTIDPIVRSRSWDYTVTSKLNGTGYNVSSWTWAAHVTTSPGAAAVATCTVDTSNAATGIVLISLPASTTSGLSQSRLWLAVDVTVGGNLVQLVRSCLAVLAPA